MWVCIKHDCSGMVGDECPHCATARLLQEEKERLLNTKNFPVDCQVKQAACEWIDVNDRLPLKDWEYVLCYEKEFDRYHIMALNPSNKRWFRNGFGNYSNSKGITHWMPLPSKPSV